MVGPRPLDNEREPLERSRSSQPLHQRDESCAQLCPVNSRICPVRPNPPGPGSSGRSWFRKWGPVAGGVGGWEINAGSPVFTHDFVRSGSWSLQESYFLGSGAYVVDQWVAVQPGSQYALSGWAMTPVRLVNDRVGYLVLTFCDISRVAIGQGIRSGTISSSMPVNSWVPLPVDRKSTRLNSSHLGISYAVFC